MDPLEGRAPMRDSLLRPLWRFLLRARFLLWQRRRHNRLVIERGLGFPLVVLPGVFNPTLFRSTPFVLKCLDGELIGAGGRVLDLCTGSGALALAAAKRATSVVAVDINPEAVRCARINALLNNFDDRVEVRHGDLFAPVNGERFDLILCNPPYYEGTPKNTGQLAFYAGDFAKRFADGLPDHLTPDGCALVVLSSDGAESNFLDAFAAAGLTSEAVYQRNLISELLTLYRLRVETP